MIVQIQDRVLQIVVPQKCGISTVVNWLAYPTWERTGTKTQARHHLGSRLLHIGGPGELEWAAHNHRIVDLRIAVVRDPVERAYSIWRDRIVKKQRHDWGDSSFGSYIDRLENLDMHSDIGLHSRHQVQWLGHDWQQYDLVVDTKFLNTRLKSHLDRCFGTDLPVLQANHSGQHRPPILPSQLDVIHRVYSHDFAFYYHATDFS